jgi:hypothetical protein
MGKLDDLKTAVTQAGTAVGNTVGSVFEGVNFVRNSVGRVLLEGVATHAMLLSSLRVELAIQVAQRLPFATPQSVCDAAHDAADQAATFTPYVVTIDTLFGSPASALMFDPRFLAIAVDAALVKATMILLLLAEVPDQPIAINPQTLENQTRDLKNKLDELRTSVVGHFDPSMLVGIPNGDTLDDLADLKTAVDQFLATLEGPPNAVVHDLAQLLAGIPKIFHAAERGCARLVNAIDIENNLLCGPGRQPARAFFQRRPHTISLDRTYPSITVGDASWAVLVGDGHRDIFKIESIGERSRAEFALSTKSTELTLEHQREDELRDRFERAVRSTTVFADSQELKIVGRPVGCSVSGDTIVLDTLVALSPNQPLAFRGQTPDTHEKVSEIAFIGPTAAAVTDDGRRTTVSLSRPLRNTYERASLRINANVAAATHGESVRELLGSSSAAVPHQRFVLKQAPVTYVSADNAAGARSTLDVRVNDLAWHEVPTLVGRGPAERVFTTSIDNDGKTTVTFGDGIEGAIPPSGQNNLRASYRKGLGHDGNVDANRLTSPLTRPAGLATVSNPDAALGGDDPESIDAARRNAPVTVLTLDRAVSIRDYEDFARTFAGIAKASAIWTPFGAGRGVFVTVAGPQGDAVPDDGQVARRLIAALRKWGDPLIPLRVRSFRSTRFGVNASVKVSPDATSDTVLADVRAALATAFSFDARDLGQPVAIDEVIAVMHGVGSVMVVDVDALYVPGAPGWHARLAAASAHVDANGAMVPAELLCINESAINLGVMP